MMELRVCHLYPDVLNLYGDRGNVLCIKKRLEWRGIGCTVTELPRGERRGLGNFDLFVVGGGQDFEQGLLLEDLRGGKGADIRAAAEDGAAFLCVCGGYQLMGHHYDTVSGARCAGLDVLDLVTEGAEERMIGNFAFETEFGPVRIKHGSGYGIEKTKPEYDDIAAIARETGLTLAEVRRKVGNR